MRKDSDAIHRAIKNLINISGNHHGQPETNAQWYVYIVQCNDGTLYAGITTGLERRIEEHNAETGGAKYTRYRQPVRLVYFEQAESRSSAAKREYAIKRMPLAKKAELIKPGL
ncbi:MAG: GIY-YIG nuclease family protein [Deltaproteobacteria bacterium]|nr:GIY-YIG nuclease family protein [Deltaproteobacteria bacterium]